MRSLAVCVGALLLLVAVLPASAGNSGGPRPTGSKETSFAELYRRIEELSDVADGLPSAALRSSSSSFAAFTDSLICKTCYGLVPVVVDLLTNAPAMLDTLADKYCADVHKNNATATQHCVTVTNDLIGLMHLLMAIANRYQFNSSVLMCADVLKVCTVPCCSTPYTPEQVHLSYPGGNAVGATSMWVSWVTLQPTPDAAVHWRSVGDNMGQQSPPGSAIQRTYTVAQWIGSIYGVEMTGLQPDTNYTYRVGSPTQGWSEEFWFTTLPLNAGTAARPLRVLLTADLGTNNNSVATIARIIDLAQTGQIDFFVHTGDISYADGDQYRWDRYMREMQPALSRVPYMTTPGNHEGLWNFTAYKRRMFMPTAGHGVPDDALYYTFESGPVSWVMMDSEDWYDSALIDDVQQSWAEERMRSAQERGQFTFVGFHRPMYTSLHGGTPNEEQLYLRGRIEAATREYGVAVVHVGHVHNYERTYPVFAGKVVSQNYTNAPAAFTLLNGDAGNQEGQDTFTASGAPPAWSAFRTAEIGVVVATFAANAAGTQVTMTGQLLRSSDATVLDEFSVTRDVGVGATKGRRGSRTRRGAFGGPRHKPKA